MTWIFQLIVTQRNSYLLSGFNAWLSSTLKSTRMCFSDITSLLIVIWFIIALAVLKSRIFQGEYAEESLLLSAHLTLVGPLPFHYFAPYFASIALLFIKLWHVIALPTAKQLLIQ